MLQKLKNSYHVINIYNLNIFIFLISLILFIASNIFLKNIYLIILIYIFLYFLQNKINQKIISFLTDATGIILIAYILLNSIDFSYSKIIIKTFLFIIKFSYLLNYLLMFFIVIKNKKKKSLKSKKKKKYTFKELREKNKKLFFEKTNDEINRYIESNNINLESDYSKVILDNLDNKSTNDLEEYVWLNYLRFYKLKKYETEVFDKFNFIFLIIHVIILLLVFLVR